MLASPALAQPALAQTDSDKVTVYFFWGDGCPHCAAEKPFLEEMQKKYPEIEIKIFETWKNPENAKLFDEVAKAYGTTAQGVPTTFIGDKYWIGYADHMAKEMEDKIKSCIENQCASPGDMLAKDNPTDNPLPAPSKEVPCIHVFIIGDCPQCNSVLPYIGSLNARQDIELKIHDVSDEGEKELYSQFKEIYSLSDAGFPIVFIGNKYLAGETAILENLDSEITKCEDAGCVCPASKINGITPYPPQPKDITPEESTVVELPVLGKIDTENMPLPLFTIIIAGLDSFNPCAFFILFFLLSMLIYAKSRKRMLLIGFTFVFVSALMYFLFMAAWLNLFLLIGEIMLVTTIAGAIALVVGLINVKDFFFFEKGISLVIPESAKPKLFQKMRNLLKATSLTSMMAGTIVLAIAANSYELLCTAGFPMVFTRILTLNNIPSTEYYLYLALYNLVYVIPLLIIVLMFVITLGAKKLSEWQGRVLKLISGTMMLCLGSILLIDPALLNNIFISFGLMATAVIIAGTIIVVTKITKKKNRGEKNE